MSGTRVKDYVLEQKIPLLPPVYKSFRSSVPGTGTRRTIYIFFYIIFTAMGIENTQTSISELPDFNQVT